MYYHMGKHSIVSDTVYLYELLLTYFAKKCVVKLIRQSFRRIYESHFRLSLTLWDLFQTLCYLPIVLHEADGINQRFIIGLCGNYRRPATSAWIRSRIGRIIFLSAWSNFVENAQDSNFARIGPRYPRLRLLLRISTSARSSRRSWASRGRRGQQMTSQIFATAASTVRRHLYRLASGLWGWGQMKSPAAKYLVGRIIEAAHGNNRGRRRWGCAAALQGWVTCGVCMVLNTETVEVVLTVTVRHRFSTVEQFHFPHLLLPNLVVGIGNQILAYL